MHQGRLPSATATDQRKDFAGPHGQIEIDERWSAFVAVAHGNALKLDSTTRASLREELRGALVLGRLLEESKDAVERGK